MIPEKIIKALEYCARQGITSECEGCKYKKGCRPDLIVDALALIKRQQDKIKGLYKEIERIAKMTVATDRVEREDENG